MLLRQWNKLRAFLDAYLDPSEQLTELLVGLIMVLICTLMASWIYLKETAELEKQTAVDKDAKDDDEKDPRKDALETLQLAPGCNVTWGLITGLMITMNNMYRRSRAQRLQEELRDSANDAEAVALVAEELDDELAAITTEEQRQALYLQIVRRIEKTDMPGAALERKDFVAGCIIFCLVTVTIIPSYLPYLFDEKDLLLGLRVANLVLVSLLFGVGYCWGRLVRTNAWAAAVIIFLIGMAMVGLAEVLGG